MRQTIRLLDRWLGMHGGVARPVIVPNVTLPGWVSERVGFVPGGRIRVAVQYMVQV
jgi:hypothetical protein